MEIKVGDIVESNGKTWIVEQVGFITKFKNMDESDMEESFSIIGGVDEEEVTIIGRA